MTLKAYLFQSAKNKAFTYIRDKKESYYLEDLSSLDLEAGEDFELEVQELHRLIQEAVTFLPDRCKDIFKKSREEQLTNREIAQQLNISEKTVEKQITIALKRIKAFLGDSYSYLW